MRRYFFAVAAAAIALTAAAPAFALGKFGARVGSGVSFYNIDIEGASEPDITPFAIGAAFKLGLGPIGVEADALYWSHTSDDNGVETSETRLALPVMGKFDISPLPVIKVEIGAGIEPRFLLSAERTQNGKTTDESDGQKGMVMYIPVSLGAGLNLQVLELNLEARYERQITDHLEEGGDKVRHHQLMIFAGAFF